MRSLKNKIGVTVRNTDNFENELTLVASLLVLDTMQIHKYQTEKLTTEKQRNLTDDVKDRLIQSLLRYDEIMDVMTCIFLLQAVHYDVPNSLMDYDVINERLDKMIARIEENKDE